MIAENDMELIGCRQVLLGTDRTGSMDICVGLDLVIEAQKQISPPVGAGIVTDPRGQRHRPDDRRIPAVRPAPLLGLQFSIDSCARRPFHP